MTSASGRGALDGRPWSVSRLVMRVPFKTETDAFRVAVALGLLAAAAVLVGSLASRAYGVVVFAAGIAAGITFKTPSAGRETGRGSALQRAADAPHFHGASGGTRHVLVVTSVKLAGEELRRELAAGGAGVGRLRRARADSGLTVPTGLDEAGQPRQVSTTTGTPSMARRYGCGD